LDSSYLTSVARSVELTIARVVAGVRRNSRSETMVGVVPTTS